MQKMPDMHVFTIEVAAVTNGRRCGLGCDGIKKYENGAVCSYFHDSLELLGSGDDVEYLRCLRCLAKFPGRLKLKAGTVKYKPIEKDDHLMTINRWKECVDSGGFIDYDGYGCFSKGGMMSNVHIKPSDYSRSKMFDELLKFLKDEKFTHVVWFNR